MTKAIALLPILLAAAFVAQAQNLTRSIKDVDIQRCLLGDTSTAEGLTPRAVTTCPPSPPPSGNWSATGWQKVFASNYGTWAYDINGSVNVPQGACDPNSLACTVNFPLPIQNGDTLYIQPFIYAGGQINLTSCTGESIVKFPSAQIRYNSTYAMISTAYVLSAIGGEQSITCFVDGYASGWLAIAVVVNHWGGSGGVTFDAAATKLANCATTNTGVGLNLSGSTDWIVTTNTPLWSNANAVAAPYSLVAVGNYAQAVNVSSAPAPTWSQPPPVNGASIDDCLYGAIAFTGH